MCLWLHVWCAYMFRWRPEVDAGCLSQSLSFIYRGGGLSLAPRVLRWGYSSLASLLLHFLALIPSHQNYRRVFMPACIDIFMGARGLNSGSNAWPGKFFPGRAISSAASFISHFWETLRTVESIRESPEDWVVRLALLSPVGKWYFSGFLNDMGSSFGSARVWIPDLQVHYWIVTSLSLHIIWE